MGDDGVILRLAPAFDHPFVVVAEYGVMHAGPPSPPKDAGVCPNPTGGLKKIGSIGACSPFVIPAKARIQGPQVPSLAPDARLRGNDGKGIFARDPLVHFFLRR